MTRRRLATPQFPRQLGDDDVIRERWAPRTNLAHELAKLAAKTVIENIQWYIQEAEV